MLKPLLGALALLLIAFPVGSRAADEVVLPAEVLAGAEHLLGLTGPGGGRQFQPERIAGLMSFVTRPKKDGERFTAESGKGLSSSYNEVDVRIRLSDMLQYSFNPAIPWFAMTPSSLRITTWKQTSHPWREFPRLWELLGSAGAPVVIRGMETVENTPDLSTGGYYRYDLHRTLILFSSGSRRTVISISKQADVSDVGRKGYILGKDEDWNYFYSGQPGLNRTGLGWVKSYMFDSAGICVYTGADPGAALVRIGNFKWLRAGWANINMVQNEHIYQGMGRFARAFREILESPRLPAVRTLENACLEIAHLPEPVLRDRMKPYRRLLAARGEKLSGGARQHLPESFWSETYWDGLGREEMQSALVLEALKAHLGKSPDADWRSLSRGPTAQPPRQGG